LWWYSTHRSWNSTHRPWNSTHRPWNSTHRPWNSTHRSWNSTHTLMMIHPNFFLDKNQIQTINQSLLQSYIEQYLSTNQTLFCSLIESREFSLLSSLDLATFRMILPSAAPSLCHICILRDRQQIFVFPLNWKFSSKYLTLYMPEFNSNRVITN